MCICICLFICRQYVRIDAYIYIYVHTGDLHPSNIEDHIKICINHLIHAYMYVLIILFIHEDMHAHTYMYVCMNECIMRCAKCDRQTRIKAYILSLYQTPQQRQTKRRLCVNLRRKAAGYIDVVNISNLRAKMIRLYV